MNKVRLQGDVWYDIQHDRFVQCFCKRSTAGLCNFKELKGSSMQPMKSCLVSRIDQSEGGKGGALAGVDGAWLTLLCSLLQDGNGFCFTDSERSRANKTKRHRHAAWSDTRRIKECPRPQTYLAYVHALFLWVSFSVVCERHVPKSS